MAEATKDVVVEEKVIDVIEETSILDPNSSNEVSEEVVEEKQDECCEKETDSPEQTETVDEDESEVEAAVEASEELNIMDDAKTIEIPEENENTKAHFYRFRREGFKLNLDPNGFVSTILMKKFRFGIILKSEDVDFIEAADKCLSFVMAALNKINDPDIVVREIKTPQYLNNNKFYNVVSVHVPFHANINNIVKEMRNTANILNENTDKEKIEFLVRISNYADLIIDSSKQGKGFVCFKGFQSLTYSKSNNPNHSSRESINAGLYANELLDFKQKDISYVNKANLNVCKMNLFGENVKFDPISHHDINFGKRFGCIIWEIIHDEDKFKLVRYICDINLRDYKAFGKIYVTDGVKTTITKEELSFHMELPPFEKIFQHDGNVEILCTMLGSPRTDNRWKLFDNDVDIIDECMFDISIQKV